MILCWQPASKLGPSENKGDTAEQAATVPPVVLSWLPGADNCRNFFERFTFCPESLKRRAKPDIEESQGSAYRHPLLLAYEFQELLEAEVVNNRAAIARRYKLSRARVTQVMSLLRLPEEIRQYVISLPPGEQQLYSGRRLGEIVGLANEAAQLAALDELRRTAHDSQLPTGLTGLHGTGEGEVMHLAADHLPSG